MRSPIKHRLFNLNYVLFTSKIKSIFWSLHTISEHYSLNISGTKKELCAKIKRLF